MIRAIDKWLWPYLSRQRSRQRSQPLHVMLCVCDHFEPLHDTDHDGALRRLDEWQARWPAMVREFEGLAADGVGPRHTFFYPIEQYHRELLDPIAELCRASGAEVEVHLHHDRDTAENLERALREGCDALASHGLLSRARGSGELRYGFIHGNWALDDSDPRGQGRGCGVRGELGILRRSGCYGDFTMPSAPHPTQARTINSIYYAQNGLQGKSHDLGIAARVADTRAYGDDIERLLLVQGPLGLNWQRRKWGLLPRIENGELTGANPPTLERAQLWIELAPAVVGQPDWRFIKLHTHGGIPQNYETLLGDSMRGFLSSLAKLEGRGIRLHFVSARELINLVHAAEEGRSGDPHDWRDHRFERLSTPA